MNFGRLLLAITAIVIVASNINSAIAGNNTQIIPMPNFTIPANLTIGYVNTANVSTQNSMPAKVIVQVTNILNKNGMCGLKLSNFKLTTLNEPTHGPIVGMTRVVDAGPDSHGICYDIIQVAPTGTAKWVAGTYVCRLEFSYVQGGPIAATNYFSFHVNYAAGEDICEPCLSDCLSSSGEFLSPNKPTVEGCRKSCGCPPIHVGVG